MLAMGLVITTLLVLTAQVDLMALKGHKVVLGNPLVRAIMAVLGALVAVAVLAVLMLQ